MSGSRNALQISDPYADSDNPLSKAPSWADAWGYVTAPVSALDTWLASVRAKHAQTQDPVPIWNTGNAVGTERVGDPEMRNAQTGFQPAAEWGGQPVSQRFRDMVDMGTGVALGFAGSAGRPTGAEPWLLPAYRQGGKVYPGLTHYDASATIPGGIKADAATGFINDKGQFLNRTRAHDYATKHDLAEKTWPASFGDPPTELWSEAGLRTPQAAFDYLDRFLGNSQ